MSIALQAALSRLITMLMVLGVAILLIVYVPDPNVKVVAVGLATATIMALEEFIKTTREQAPKQP